MKRLLVLGILLTCIIGSCFAQPERKVPFSNAISAHIVKYNRKMDAAYKDQDLEMAKFMFDSLVSNHLNGTYMDNFNVYPIKGDPIALRDYQKPIFLITTASWCVPGVGEIPALNDLVDRFYEQIDFVVLFWDTKDNLIDKSKEYSENTHLVYINEKTNHDSSIVNTLKHSLGFPMMYLMDDENKIMDIRKVVTHHSSETLSNSYNIHFNSLSKGVSMLVSELGLDIEKKSEGEDGDEKITDSDQEEELYDPDDPRTEEERNIDEEYELYRREKERRKKKKKRKKDNG